MLPLASQLLSLSLLPLLSRLSLLLLLLLAAVWQGPAG
jgi:hypothetical protein